MESALSNKINHPSCILPSSAPDAPDLSSHSQTASSIITIVQLLGIKCGSFSNVDHVIFKPYLKHLPIQEVCFSLCRFGIKFPCNESSRGSSPPLSQIHQISALTNRPLLPIIALVQLLKLHNACYIKYSNLPGLSRSTRWNCHPHFQPSCVRGHGQGASCRSCPRGGSRLYPTRVNFLSANTMTSKTSDFRCRTLNNDSGSSSSTSAGIALNQALRSMREALQGSSLRQNKSTEGNGDKIR